MIVTTSALTLFRMLNVLSGLTTENSSEALPSLGGVVSLSRNTTTTY